ncbi:NEL-type E3 ubiquitin ligase domain-containing protein [Escherichia fergusonii]|uniref:NEL-type E3 ubiquitin ligase domain-containing protein n=1 Tax=Escherichia fergusonii TaxID=564 RepID=UPI0035BFCA05
MLQALFSPEEHPVHPRTLATWPASSCHQLLSLLCAENAAELASGDRKLLNQMLLQMTGTGIHDTYHTPVFDDGSRLTLNLSVAGQATLTAYAPGQTLFCGLTLTPVHPAWADVCNGPVHATLIHEWRNWSAEPAHGERRDEALRRVTECVVQGETKLNLDNLGLSSLPTLLPPMLKALYICKNRLNTLPELPPTLAKLIARNNQLTVLPVLPASLETLNVRNNQLTVLPVLPASLRVLHTSINELTALPVLPASLRVLDTSSNELTVLPELPHSLRTLNVLSSWLTTLPDLPASLEMLYVSSFLLTTLPDLPDSLRTLCVSNTRLTALPDLPDSLRTLCVSDTGLTALPDLPASLTKLVVSYNEHLTALPELPDSLRTLDASFNHLTALPPLPASLENLQVFNNQLTSLPDLPPSLKVLEVGGDWLISLPNLPPTLTSLNVCNCPLVGLSAFPALPVSLTSLVACNIPLTTLPSLPVSLTRLDIRWNYLTTLPDLPAALTSLKVNYNYLADLPPLPASLQGQDVGFSNQRTGSSALASAIVPWYPEKRPEIVCPAWFPRAAEENADAFTEFLKLLDDNTCARSPVFRGRVAAWLDELLITPELCTLSFAIAQEASTSCTDRAALGWNNMQVGRLLFHAVRNEHTTADAFITLARQIFRLRQTERIAGEKVLALTAAHEDVDEIEVYLAYQTRLKVPLGLPDCLAPEMQFGFLARVTPEDINIAAETVLLAEEGEFGNWLNNWEPCQQFLLKRMSEDEREELTERRIAVYSEQLEELRLEFRDAGAGTDVDRVLGVRATEATNNAIFGPLAELAFFMPT